MAPQRAPAQPAGPAPPAQDHDPRSAKAVAGLTGESPDADTKKIMTAITEAAPAEARQEAHATDEELARTYPGGKVKDTDETVRRPGTD